MLFAIFTQILCDLTITELIEYPLQLFVLVYIYFVLPILRSFYFLFLLFSCRHFLAKRFIFYWNLRTKGIICIKFSQLFWNNKITRFLRSNDSNVSKHKLVPRFHRRATKISCDKKSHDNVKVVSFESDGVS